MYLRKLCYVYILNIFIYNIYILIYNFQNIYCICVYLYIHYKYTQYTYIYYVNKNLYFAINRLTALYIMLYYK